MLSPFSPDLAIICLSLFRTSDVRTFRMVEFIGRSLDGKLENRRDQEIDLGGIVERLRARAKFTKFTASRISRDLARACPSRHEVHTGAGAARCSLGPATRADGRRRATRPSPDYVRTGGL
jgi:hypothetical protein